MIERRPFYVLYALVFLTGVFVTLKLFDVFPWSWFAVFSPIWTPIVMLVGWVVIGLLSLMILSTNKGIKQ